MPDDIIQNDAPPTTAVAEYNPIATALAELRHQLEGRAYNLRTVKGNEEARADRKRLVALRNRLEDLRLSLNRADRATIAERIKTRDEEAERITAAIVELEAPIDQQIKADEARREQERQAREQAEQQRVSAIRAEIDAIRQIAVEAAGYPSTVIEDMIRNATAIEIDSRFAEFEAEAAGVRDATLARLRNLLDVALEAEAKAAELTRQLEEVERQRAAEAERQRQEQARIEAENRLIAGFEAIVKGCVARAPDAIAAGITHFNSLRLGATDLSPRAVDAIDNLRSRLVTMLADAQERERLAAERATFEAQQAAAREAQERADAEARARREAEDREAAAKRAEADRIAREAREAEKRLLAEQAAELNRQREEQERQAAEARAAEEARRAADRAELERIEAEIRASEDRVRNAAPELLAALQCIVQVAERILAGDPSLHSVELPAALVMANAALRSAGARPQRQD
jgi:IgA-specific serine endopeptidase